MRHWAMTAAALLLVRMAAGQTPATTIAISESNRTVAVSAMGETISMADVAQVQVGFVLYGLDEQSVYASGTTVSNAIVAALKQAGVPADAIESQNQSVNPVQPYELNNLSAADKAQRKWELTQSWTVRTDAANAAHVLDVAVKAGANQSGSIEWTLANEDQPRSEALQKALTHARALAGEMARGMDVHLGKLLYASNQVTATPIRPFPMMQARAVAAPEPLAVNPRRITTTVTVYAVFAIE